MKRQGRFVTLSSESFSACNFRPQVRNCYQLIFCNAFVKPRCQPWVSTTSLLTTKSIPFRPRQRHPRLRCISYRAVKCRECKGIFGGGGESRTPVFSNFYSVIINTNLYMRQGETRCFCFASPQTLISGRDGFQFTITFRIHAID